MRENRHLDKEKGPLSFDRQIPTPRHLLEKPAPARDADQPKLPKEEMAKLAAAMGIPADMSDSALRMLRSRLEQEGKLPASDWYNWRVCHWGTKWDVVEADVKRIPDGVRYVFDTAWGPPTEWMEEVSTRYPLLQFKLEYGEAGNDFAGVVVVQNNTELERREGRYDEFYDDYWEDDSE